MSESFERARKIIDESSVEEREALKIHLKRLLPHPLEAEWGIDGDTILTAILRSSDLTKRGVRGIIAEAVFENDVIPSLSGSGWEAVPVSGDLSYDAELRRDNKSVRIQIKLQRLEKGTPKLYYPKRYQEGTLFVVEVQKTRSGERTAQVPLQGTDSQLTVTEALTEDTRPYRFSDFDILAVNMHPSTGDWRNFRYTLASGLLARSKDQSLIEIFQPVSAIPNDIWTDNIASCLSWVETGEKRPAVADLLNLGKK